MSATTSKIDLRVRLMGPLTIDDARGRSLLPKGRKARGILGYLFFQAGKPVTRPKLVDMFWPDRAMEQGSASLRQSIHEIRRAFGPVGDGVLRFDRESVRVQPDRTVIDLWGEGGRYDARLTEPFLDGLDPVAWVFDDWVDEMRRVIRTTQLNVAEEELAAAERALAAPEIERAARVVLALDPSHEPAARKLFAALAQMGKLAAAKSEFETLQRTLADDGFEVSADTRAVFEEIRRPQPSSLPRALSPAKSRMPVIRVAALPPGGDSPSDPVLAAALADEIESRLARLPELSVAVEGPGGGEGGDWDFVLDCAVMPSPGRTVSNLRLIHAATGRLSWTAREVVDHARFHEALPLLAGRYAANLLAAVERLGMEALQDKPAKDCSAYEHYLRAKHSFYRAERADFVEDVQRELEAAIAKDPGFLPAYPHLIQSYNTGGMLTQPGLPLGPGRDRALQLAETLLARDSRLASAHIAMGWCQLWKRNFGAAERCIDQAIAIGAYEAHRLNAIGNALVYLGRHDEGEAFYDEARARMQHELDYQRSDYGELYYLKRDHENALSWLDYGERRTPYRTLFWRAAVLAQLGRLAEARADLDALVKGIRSRWSGPKPCRLEDAVRWYVAMVPLKREIDRDHLADGLAKVGVVG